MDGWMDGCVEVRMDVCMYVCFHKHTTETRGAKMTFLHRTNTTLRTTDEQRTRHRSNSNNAHTTSTSTGRARACRTRARASSNPHLCNLMLHGIVGASAARRDDSVVHPRCRHSCQRSDPRRHLEIEQQRLPFLDVAASHLIAVPTPSHHDVR